MLTAEMPTLEEAQQAISRGRRLSGGSVRKVYHIPHSKWVYKVDIRPGTYGCNADEYEAYQAKKDNLPEGIYLPRMFMLDNGILAAEFIDGAQPPDDCGMFYHECFDRASCFWTHYSDKLREVSCDVHFQNVLIAKTGKIYVIDLGHDNPNRGRYSF